MQNIELNWKVAGFAGEGIMTTGLLFSKICTRHGLQTFDYTEYPSLIRGGHNTYQVFASDKSATSQKKLIDVLVALNKNSLAFHREELKQNSVTLFDQEDDKVEIANFNLPGKTINLPMVRLAEKSGAKRIMANNVALGASVYLLGLEWQILAALIRETFKSKGQEVVDQNLNSAQAGYRYFKDKLKPLFTVKKEENPNLLTVTGNEAAGLGALAGGMKCYVAYPMTPSSSVLHFLAANAAKGNYLVKHAEDEIGTVNMALGTAYSGVRTMVGTSGGGFCYMTEALGLSGVAEIPLVVFEAMRPGPALGMPTWTAQGDLLFAINASQDEFPRIVLTPGDGQEMFELTKNAQELAEKYQTLIIILSDKHLSESRYTLNLEQSVFTNQRHSLNLNPAVDETGFYPRYSAAENGVSRRSLPGQIGGMYLANSYEHDRYGFATEEAETRIEQMDKRMKKMDSMRSEIPRQFMLTHPGSQLTVISFGSTKGAVISALNLLEKENLTFDFLNLSWIWPFPEKQVRELIKDPQKTLVIEGNHQGQLAKIITQETGIILPHSLRKYDGRPFYAEEIAEYIKSFNQHV